MRRNFVYGVMLGVGCCVGAIGLYGMAPQQDGMGLRTSQSMDGRTVFLWSVDDYGVKFVSYATAPEGIGVASGAAMMGQPGAPMGMTNAAPDVAAAQGMLDQALEYIKGGKLDLAEPLLTKLEGMSGLPQSMQTQVKAARDLLNVTKAKSGLPGLPKFPK